MSIKIVPHSIELEEAVFAFNQRMQDGGSGWGFYSRPDLNWLPKVEGAKTWREFYLALEDDTHVRGGFALKPQLWLVDGQAQWVCDWQGPFSEGAINPRYATLGLRFIRDMLKRYPLLFSNGHGGSDEPMLKLLRTLGWTLHGTPFCLYVARPFRFLRHNRYLRVSAAKRLAMDVLAYSGAGPIGIRALQLAQRVRHGARRSHATAVSVDRFDSWTDDLWDRNKSEYSCLAVRDSQMMNALIPAHGYQNAIRLRVDRDGKPIGWAIVHHKVMQNDGRFGTLHVGLISDCFSSVTDAADVINAAHEFLVNRNVDLIYSNQSHPAWVDAFRKSGYVVLEDRRFFACSPQMSQLIGPLETKAAGLHLTNMDGHGPHGFN